MFSMCLLADLMLGFAVGNVQGGTGRHDRRRSSRSERLELRLFSRIMTLGTPQDVTLQELGIEAFVPANEESEKNWRRVTMISKAPQSACSISHSPEYFVTKAMLFVARMTMNVS